MDLERPEQIALQSRMWVVERIGWFLMATFLLAAALGLFGSGPLSKAITQDPAGLLRVEYSRFLRVGADSMIRIEAKPPISVSEVEIRIAQSFLRKVQIERINPEPLRDILVGESRCLRFAMDPSNPGAEIAVRYRPENIGAFQYWISMGDGITVSARQFVYP